ncbi:hypothetical protein BK010_09280 [Tenericutes bacterium MO-XQ]|nr:hypothetical protein BK010_09280 [Tenericutes bacterium MO-XQ]
MQLFFKIIDNVIIEVYSENLTNNLIEIEASNMDSVFEKIKEYQFDKDIEDQIEDIFTIQEDDNSIASFNIKHWVSNRSYGELIDMYENDEIIKPKMQRNFVWDSIKCSRLIESIIIGLPIPPLFLLEIDKNKYELIDGFQRLSTVFNYIKGYPWHGYFEGKRNITSRLSKKISKDLQGKTFNQLTDEHKRILKRSTIPLIEFKQLEPDNLNSKYMIFERINTGSEKLNQMQIRKSLTYGTFIEELYKNGVKNDLFIELFSSSSIKKDSHIEAYLRVKVMTEVAYGDFTPDASSITGILNEYCNSRKDSTFSKEYIESFDKAISLCYSVFENSKDMFRRVEKNLDEQYEITGNLNVSILESFIGTVMRNYSNINIQPQKIYQNYLNIMYDTLRKSLDNIEDNPFTISTGVLNTIYKRYQICKKILEV